MGSWHSPQSIYNVGHRVLKDFFDNEVQIQEKIDGSFFAFGAYPDDQDYPLKVRSKGAVMAPEAPMAMFRSAVNTVIDLMNDLHPGWMYRGECLSKPKHNALAYDRVPKGNVILFDILTDEEAYLSYDELVAEGARLGLEVVPQLFTGKIDNAVELRKFLDVTSVLGGQKLEGVVVKPLTPVYGPDKKLVMAKFVSEHFKEVHKMAWGESNPTKSDIFERLGKAYGTPARWQKSIQHLRERGIIQDSPRDIGPLINEIKGDIKKECQEEILDALWKYAWPHIERLVTRDFPSWYKDRLLELQFEHEGATTSSGEPNNNPQELVGNGGEDGHILGVDDPIDDTGNLSDTERK